MPTEDTPNYRKIKSVPTHETPIEQLIPGAIRSIPGRPKDHSNAEAKQDDRESS